MYCLSSKYYWGGVFNEHSECDTFLMLCMMKGMSERVIHSMFIYNIFAIYTRIYTFALYNNVLFSLYVEITRSFFLYHLKNPNTLGIPCYAE